MDDYALALKLRLDWSEMDMFGHVNNVSYFKFIQASRVNYWEHAELDKYHKETNMGPMLASTTCDFKQPLFYPGSIRVLARVSFMKNTSFGIEHLILNEHDQIAAEAKDVLVFFDFNKNEKITIPDSFRHLVAAIEGKDIL